jgi:hypothetical protein
MLKRVLIAVAAAFLTTTALAKRPDVLVIGDRFTRSVEAHSESASVSNSALDPDRWTRFNIWLSAFWKDGKFDRYELGVSSINNPPKFGDCHDLVFLVNGKPFSIEPEYTPHRAAPDNPYVREEWTARLSEQAAMEFATATSIEVRACKIEPDPLDRGDLDRLRKWKAVVDDAVQQSKSPKVNWEVKDGRGHSID